MRFLSSVILICICHLIYGQTEYSTSNKKAIRLFEEGLQNYQYKKNEAAYTFLQKAIAEAPEFYEAQLTFADLCLDVNKYDEARKAYADAARIKPDRFPPLYLRWAQADLAVEDFSAAAKHLEQFLGYPKISDENRKKANRLLRNARFAEKAVLHPVSFNPENLGPEINSIYSEYHPSITVDEQTIIYTRMRPADALTDNGGSKVEEDFYISIKENGQWKNAIPVGPPLNSHGNEGAHSLSPDGRTIFFTACERPGGIGSCDLYVSERKGNSWSTPVNLGEAVNSPTWDAQPTISADGQTLVFVSRRAGGKGMSDLWCSEKQANGSWGMAFNLSDSLNTDQDESGPFLHPDGRSLYFSSAGHPGMGGRDFFVSRKGADGIWTAPVNLGYPVNTSSDESHMIISADGAFGYFSSDRPGGVGQKDIYRFALSEAVRPAAVTFMKGIVQHAKTGAKLEARFEVIDVYSGRTMAISKSDAQTGSFLVSLPAGSSYAVNVSAPGFLFFSENYTLSNELKPSDVFQANINLMPIAAGEKIVLKNIFFASGSSKLEETSLAELKKLFDFLKSNPSLKIEIGGHTDDVGADDANLKLSQERANAVKAFLLENGIAEQRVTSKGYGETKPVSPNTTDEGRKQNRRTEFSILP
jgi:outer membrane protein OmpA-like peptidoglycan-associated protein